jgi:hypothetical protein
MLECRSNGKKREWSSRLEAYTIRGEEKEQGKSGRGVSM